MSVKRDHQQMELRRKRAGVMFNKGYSASEVARRLGVGRQSTCRWKAAWEAGGSDALKSKGQAGRKPRLTAGQRSEVVAALVEGPLARGYRTNLWTLPRVALLIKDLTGVDYHPGHVWHLLRALGFSCQRPTRRAIERDEEKIVHWKSSTWLALKKKPAKKAAPLSFSTKAD
jgi:transposase